jgi:RNA polymerase sigma factor (sigma-70 family)
VRSMESGRIAFAVPQADVAARLGVLYRRHRDQVFRIARRYARDSAWAEDITQDVFVSLCRSFDRIDDDTDMRAWFYRVTHNVCLSRLRREALAATPGVRWLLGHWTQDEPDPERSAAGRQSVERMFDALAVLGARERVAFCMYHLDGKEQAEIGDILGFGKSYVCKLIKRAEARLREDGWNLGI